MNARSVIIRPVISEKSYALLTANKYTFRVHDGANKTQVRQAVEEIFGVRVHDVRTQNVKPKPKRRGFTAGKRRAVEEGHRDAAPRRLDRAVRRPGDRLAMAIKKHKPTSPGRRFATYSDRAEVTKDKPGEVAHRGPQEVRRAQLQGPHDLAPPRRRGQAPVPQDRLQAPQGRRAGQGRRDRVRPQPHRLHRAAPLRRRREVLHPRPGAAEASATRCSPAPGSDITVGNCLPLAQHPHRHHGPQRRADGRAAAASSAAPPAPRSSSWRRRATTRRCACPPARCAWCASSAAPRSARSATPSTRTSTLGKAGRSRHKGRRPQTRGTAMNPVDHPHGGGEGSTTAGRHPVTPWGVPTLGYRTRKKNKKSDRYIVRGRRRGKKGSAARCPAPPRRARGSRSA